MYSTIFRKPRQLDIDELPLDSTLHMAHKEKIIYHKGYLWQAGI